MPKPGRPKRLVNACAEFWAIEDLGKLPEMRGIYILYDRSYEPLYVGRSGRGKSDIRNRIYGESRARYKGPKIAYFSAYDLDSGYHRQIETLFLRAMAHRLRWCKNKGKFPKTTKRFYRPV